MSDDVIEIKRVDGIKIKLDGQVYELNVPSMDDLMGFLSDKELSPKEAITLNRDLLKSCGLDEEVLKTLRPLEFKSITEALAGDLGKKI